VQYGPLDGSSGQDGQCSDVDATLQVANVYRSAHQAPALTWSPSLASLAQAYADHLAAQGCDAPLSHSSTGELLYWAWRGSSSCQSAVSDWYAEVRHGYIANH
jgi:uncharacterized protein YkwD